MRKLIPEDDGSDTDFQFRDEGDAMLTEEFDSEAEFRMPTVKARPFKRVKVPTGQAPYYTGADGPLDLSEYTEHGSLPSSHMCSACDESHPLGWCRIKLAAVEHCGLCGIAHLGHGRTCPHLGSEAQVVTLLQTLKESTEPRELVDQAVKYLRMIRGDLVQRKRNREKKLLEAEAKAKAERDARSNIVTGDVPANASGNQANGVSNGIVNGITENGGYREATMSGT